MSRKGQDITEIKVIEKRQHIIYDMLPEGQDRGGCIACCCSALRFSRFALRVAMRFATTSLLLLDCIKNCCPPFCGKRWDHTTTRNPSLKVKSLW
jgi:hypothetical protein